MYTLTENYSALRKQAFDWKDDGVPPATPVGFILETGYPTAVFTLVALSEGAVSLYFSNGGGMIGAGAHRGPAEAARNLLLLARTYIDLLPEVGDTPIPQPGEARMYVLLNNGLRGAAAPDNDFGENRSRFSPLFHAAHRLITEISRINP